MGRIEQNRQKDYLKPIINEAKQLPHSKDLQIKFQKISDSIAMYSLYGEKVDGFVGKFKEYRAINQKKTADKIVKEIFTDVFKSSSKPRFNFDIHFRDLLDLKYLKKNFPNIRVKELDIKNPDGTLKYGKAEIDAALKVALNFEDNKNKNKNIPATKGYIFAEMKLFTAPIKQRDKSLRNLLQQKQLANYFKLRYIFGVIGISYLSSEGDDAPIVKNDPELEKFSFSPLWVLHLVLMDARVLNKYKNAPIRSEKILRAISKVQNKIGRQIGYDQKEFKFKLIYNILKVIGMSQKIATLENKVGSLENKNRTLENKVSSLEKEKRKAEAYRKQLIKLGFDPDTIK